MLRAPHQQERDAMGLDDIASAVDAGLPPAMILPGVDLSRGFVAGMVAQGRFRSSTAEQAMLEAAETAGTLPASLRLMADQRRKHAASLRHLRRRVAYPGAVMALAVATAFVTAPIRGQTYTSLALTFAAVAAGLLLVFLWARGRLRDPTFAGGPPMLRDLLQDLGEVPYLQSLLGLYGAGVKLAEAHGLAANSVGVPFVRHRLRLAQGALQDNRGFAESLAGTKALCAETDHLVRTGEVAGDLEDALRRALDRRRQSLELRLEWWARTVGTTLYAVVCVWVVYLVLSFYGAYYGRLLGR